MGHSIRFGNYRYTEWRPRNGGKASAAVLTDLLADPGEVTNVINSAEHAQALELARRILNERIKQATVSKASVPQPILGDRVQIHHRDRQALNASKWLH